MDQMTMEYGPLADALAELRRVAGELDRGRTTVHRSFADFLGGGWQGQAAESFRGGWDEWSTGVGEVLSALGTLTDLLEQHGSGLRGLDGETGGTVDALHARLGGTGGSY